MTMLSHCIPGNRETTWTGVKDQWYGTSRVSQNQLLTMPGTENIEAGT